MLEEYDFRNDTVNANLDIDLKPATVIRSYQETSLSKMFGNGWVPLVRKFMQHAHPIEACAFGNHCPTLWCWKNTGRNHCSLHCKEVHSRTVHIFVGETILITESCLRIVQSFCSAMEKPIPAMVQYYRQTDCCIHRWPERKGKKHVFETLFLGLTLVQFAGESGIVVSTYSMVANTHNRSHDSKKMMDFLTSREWGFILLDEVHVVPAAMFRRVVTTIKAHSKLGLTGLLHLRCGVD